MSCDSCESRFVVDQLRTSKVNVRGGDGLRLTYFACPECGRLFRVTLGDNRTDEVARCADSDSERIHRLMLRAISKGDDSEYDRLSDVTVAIGKRRADAVAELNDRYPGEFHLGNPQTGDDAVCVNVEDDLWYRGPELG